MVDMSTSVPPPANWPLRPDTKLPRRDLAAEILELRRQPARGKLTGLSVAIADWLGIDVLLVRTLVVVSSLSAGVGAVGYLVGWAITRDDSTGQAPLDRLGDRWRQLNPRTVIAWAAGAILLFGLTFGSILGFGWLPLIVIAVTIWTGLRLPPAKPRPGLPHRPVGAPTQGLAPGAHAVPTPLPHRPIWVITLITICVAALVAGALLDANPYNIVRPAAAALLIIGLGLLVAARRGLAVGLVVAGIVVSVSMAGLAVLAPVQGNNPAIADYGLVLHYSTVEELTEPLHLDSETVTVDLSMVPVDGEHDFFIDSQDSSLTVIPPANTNVQVLVDYTDTLVWFGQQVEFGSGTVTHSNQPYPDQPTFTIHINAVGSRVEVLS